MTQGMMLRMGTLVVTRVVGDSAKLRSFKVVVDDAVVGEVQEGRALRLQVTPGVHRVQARCDWCRSPALTVEVDDSKVSEVVCRTSRNDFWAMFIRPSKYIELVSDVGELRPARPLAREFVLRCAITVLLMMIGVISVTVAGASEGVSIAFGLLLFIVGLTVPFPQGSAGRKRPS